MLDVGAARCQGWKSMVPRFAPRRRRQLGHAELVGVPPGREGDPGGLDPVGPLLGHALLVDRLALGAVRMALELGGPLVQRAHDTFAHREVVPDEVGLVPPRARKEDLVRVRNLDDPVPDRQFDVWRRHQSSPRSPATVGGQLGEVSEERPPVSAPDESSPVLDDAAEAVPFWLVLPAVCGRQLGHELGLHRREGQARVWFIHLFSVPRSFFSFIF